MLYPLKFNPILINKIWGGKRLESVLKKKVGNLQSVGESWELSGVKNNVSNVSNGFLSGKNLNELIENYKGSLVGNKIFNQFGTEFPLLIKFIDANDYLSIQVHPDDEMAKIRHNTYGKTELWYIIEAKKDAELIVGFNQEMNKEKYMQQVDAGNLQKVLNIEKVKPGDVFFMPAGRVHATGPGILFAEIQQTSDITYRIYDWDRVDDQGKERELHTNLAVDAIDYKLITDFKTPYLTSKNNTNKIIQSNFFSTNILVFDCDIKKDYSALDSFVIFMGLEGTTQIQYHENEPIVLLEKGETILMPACLNNITLIPENEESKILEIYIDYHSN